MGLERRQPGSIVHLDVRSTLFSFRPSKTVSKPSRSNEDIQRGRYFVLIKRVRDRSFPTTAGEFICHYRRLRLVGRISGAKSIPISRLKIGSFHMVEGKRLQVNSSAERYQRELAYLLSIFEMKEAAN
jgi:hypothetical protein